MLKIFTLIGSGFKWIFDPKNRWLMTFIMIALVVALFIFQYTMISNLKKQIAEQKQESERTINNLNAANDTVRNYQLANGTLRGEITGYIITLTELQDKYKDLFKQFNLTYSEWKKQPPITIIEYRTTVIEKMSNVPTGIITDKFGSDILSFRHDTIFNEGNSRTIRGLFPINKKYFLKKDSSEVKIQNIPYFAKNYSLPGSIELYQEMSLITGISIDAKTKKPTVWVETKYPGIKFIDIKGASILDDKASKKAMLQAERKFGLGIHMGAGLTYAAGQIYFGPTLSIGINWTPNLIKW